MGHKARPRPRCKYGGTCEREAAHVVAVRFLSAPDKGTLNVLCDEHFEEAGPNVMKICSWPKVNLERLR